MNLKTLRFLCVLCVSAVSAFTSCKQASPTTSNSHPKRIISLSPNTTEILYGVGAFERVIAVSKYCDYPPEVNNLPRVGDWQSMNNEFILSLKPDLVTVATAQVPFVRDRLNAMKIPTVEVPSQTLDDALNAMLIIGKATGNESQAMKLQQETRAQLDAVRERVKNLNRPRVLLVADRVPGSLRGIYIATGDSFLAQLIEVAGGDVIKPPDAGTGYVQLNKEALVALNPEIIIDLVQNTESAGALSEDAQTVWSELPQLRAVQNKRIVNLRGETYIIHPSQFVGKTAERFARIIHPQAFQ